MVGNGIAASRSIPACAGEPACKGTMRASPPVYPRVCGGTLYGWWLQGADVGLSPRVRGNQQVRVLEGHKSGSIPACAGEPWTSTRLACSKKVYPRVCGGTGAGCWEVSPGGGLSPRVRGNHRLSLTGLDEIRSIPACAGEPPTYFPAGRTSGVYPRVCGGTELLLPCPGRRSGLSPRVRGNPGRCLRCRPSGRSIPACAGEPRWVPTRELGPGVYPRVCGGTSTWGSRKTFSGGLSPRVRGNPGWEGPASSSYRSIPACAGEPSPVLLLGPAVGVYPRVCGGTTVLK